MWDRDEVAKEEYEELSGATSSILFTALVGHVNLEEWSLKMRWTEIACNSQLYSKHQTIYTLKVKVT